MNRRTFVGAVSAGVIAPTMIAKKKPLKSVRPGILPVAERRSVGYGGKRV
jgi:hypothetical protein